MYVSELKVFGTLFPRMIDLIIDLNEQWHGERDWGTLPVGKKILTPNCDIINFCKVFVLYKDCYAFNEIS